MRTALPVRAGLAALTTLGLSFGLAACAGSGPDRAVDSVGHVSGSTALIAVVADDDTVSAYVCDGPSGTGERFTGALDLARHAELHSPSGATLAVDVGSATAQGVFTPVGGQSRQFTTEAATGPDAGLYLADGTSGEGAYSAGWVLLNDGTQNGALRLLHGKPKRAPRLAHLDERVPVEGEGFDRRSAPAPRRSDGRATAAPRIPSGAAQAADDDRLVRLPGGVPLGEPAPAPAAQDGRATSRPSDRGPVLAPRRPSGGSTATAPAVDPDGLVPSGERLGGEELPLQTVPGGRTRIAGDVPLRAILDDGTTVTPRRATAPRTVLGG